MKNGGSIAECGHISDYNGEKPPSLSAEEKKKVDEKKLSNHPVRSFPRQAEWPAGISAMAKLIKVTTTYTCVWHDQLTICVSSNRRVS
jgi:NADPH-dependent curcumin reductase CurA